MKKILVTICTTGLIFICSCMTEEPIEDFIKGNKHLPEVVVQGAITTELRRHEVKIHYSKALGELNKELKPVEVDNIIIYSDTDTFPSCAN